MITNLKSKDCLRQVSAGRGVVGGTKSGVFENAACGGDPASRFIG